MKIGNQRLNISFIEIIGVVISVVGIILFFTLNDPLLSILSICVSAMCFLGLAINFNTKLNTTEKNQFAPSSYYKKSNIKQENQTSDNISTDGNGSYEDIQMNNKGFVIVNRAESLSNTNSPQSPTPLHSYDIDETDDYKTNVKAYSIVSADIVDDSPAIESTTKPATPPAPEIDSSNEDVPHDNDILTEHNTEEEIDTTQAENNKQTQDADLFTPIEEAADLPIDTPEVEPVSTPQESVETEPVAIPQPENTPEPPPIVSNTPNIPVEEAKKQSVELHISNMLATEQHANPSLTDLSKITAKLLVLISQAVRYTTAGFVWIDYEKQHLILESYICDSQIESLIIEQFPISNNKFTEIITTGSPLLIAEKYQPEVEQQYFQYYSQPIGVKSFIGIPIIHKDTIAAVLFVDSNKHKYSNVEYQYMQSFSQSFSSLISLYDASINNENATQILETINGFSSIIAEGDGNINNICSAITNFIWNNYGNPSTGVVTYNSNKEAWTINSYRSKESVSNKFLYEAVNIEQALVGASIIKSQQVLLSTVSADFVRVNEHENSAQVSFISIPIKSATVCYGALFIESSDANLITSIDSTALETLCNQAGGLIEHLKLTRLFDNYVSTEINMDILTRNAFNRTIETEIARSLDSNSSLFLIFVALDEYSYFSDNYKKTQIFQYIVELLKTQIKPFEIIGRVTENVVGLLLFNRDIHHVELMMETIRRKLATQYIEIHKEKLSATISVGINELAAEDSWKSFTTNATTALKFAQKKTNSIKTYQ